MTADSKSAEVLFRALETLRVPYVLVGSVASSAHGEPRATMDIDMVAQISEEVLDRLATELGAEFYFDVETARDQIRRGMPFNIISNRDVTKFDFFPAQRDAFGLAQLARAGRADIEFLSGMEVPVASPEDVVLAKLRWYDQGGRTSERQWSDILGVLRVQGERIDWAYIEEWAPRLGVADLMAKLPRFS